MRSLHISTAFILVFCIPLFAQQNYLAQQNYFAQQKYFENKLISGLGVPGILEVGHPCEIYDRLQPDCDTVSGWKLDSTSGLEFKLDEAGTISMVKCTSSVFTAEYDIRVGKPVTSIYRNYGKPLKQTDKILLYNEIAFEIEEETIKAIIILPSEKLIKKKR